MGGRKSGRDPLKQDLLVNAMFRVSSEKLKDRASSVHKRKEDAAYTEETDTIFLEAAGQKRT